MYLSSLQAHGNKNVAIRHVRVLEPSHDLVQMAALSAIMSKGIGFWTLIYLFLMFFSFGFVLGGLKPLSYASISILQHVVKLCGCYSLKHYNLINSWSRCLVAEPRSVKSHLQRWAHA